MNKVKIIHKLKEVSVPMVAILSAMLIGTIIILFTGKSPIDAYIGLYRGAFGDIPAFGDTLSRSTPIILIALAVAFAFKCGLFNIGVEGQLLMGALAAAYVGQLNNIPSSIHTLVAIIAAMVVSSFWALIAGLLKAYRGVHEVITTIMLNYIAYSFTAFGIDILRNTPVPKTPIILDSAKLTPIENYIKAFYGSNLNTSVFFAIIACFVINFILYKTVLGYEVRAVGDSPLAAENAGIKISKNIILAMCISGALVGLAGAGGVLGIYHSYVSGFMRGYGYEGIAVSLLANNNPFGIILSGLLFGSFSSGSLYMSLKADVPQDIVTIIQGMIILFIAANKFFKKLIIRKNEGVAI